MTRPLQYTLLIVLLCSCTASRKFDFNAAYKFKYLRYNPVQVTDSVPPLLASAEKLMLAPAGPPVIPELRIKEKYIPSQKKIKPVCKKKYMTVKDDYRNSYTAERYSAGKTAVIPFKTYNRKGIKHIKNTMGFGDLHPAFQGFIFVAIGFGLIVAGSVITGIQILPVVLIIGGIALVVFGFIKILTQL